MITKNSLRTTRIVTNFLIIICIAVGLIYVPPLLNYRQNDRYKCEGDLLSCTASVFGEDDQCHSNACWVYLEDKQIWIMKSKMTLDMYNKFIEEMNEKCSDNSYDKSVKERCRDYKDADSWQLSEGGDEYIRVNLDKAKLICRDFLFFDGHIKNNGRLPTGQEIDELRNVKHRGIISDKPCSVMYINGLCDLAEIEMQNEWISGESSTFRCVAEGPEIKATIE